MNQKIVSFRFDKVRAKHIDQQGLDHGEFIRQQVFSVGLSMHTPNGDMSEVISIEMSDDGEWMVFTVNYKNGETWIIYPVPPFDYGCDTLETKNKKDGD